MFRVLRFFLAIFVCVLAACATVPEKNAEVLTDSFPKIDLSKAEFIIGVGDTLEISVYREDNLKRSVKIDQSGKIMFPMTGDIEVAGKNLFAVRDEIRTRLMKYLRNPQVSVQVTAMSSRKYMVLGEVHAPGIFVLDTDISLLDAIAKAGGMTNDSDESNLVLVRRGQDKPEVASINYKDILQNGDVARDVSLRSGDIVYASTRKIASVSRFMQYIGTIISPIVSIETGIALWPQTLDVLKGKSTHTNITLPVQ